MKILGFLPILLQLILIWTIHIESKRLNCCLPAFSGLGFGCFQSDVIYANQTYTCSKVQQSCPYCNLAFNVSSSSCSYCCTILPETCTSSTPVNSSSSTSWGNIRLLFNRCLFNYNFLYSFDNCGFHCVNLLLLYCLYIR